MTIPENEPCIGYRLLRRYRYWYRGDGETVTSIVVTTILLLGSNACGSHMKSVKDLRSIVIV